MEATKKKLMQTNPLQGNSNHIVRLSVGGQSMQASRAVLTFAKGSTLEAMFSGRHPIM